MNAQKRISAPRTYNIKRKEKAWIMKVSSGPHNNNAVPLTMLLRDLVKIAKNANEVKRLLLDGKVLIDGKARKDVKFPVGFMDSVSIHDAKKHYRVIYDAIGRLKCIPISSKESEMKLVSIKKKMRMNDKYQITTHDGRNLLIKLADGKNYSVGDTLLIKLPSQEVIKHLAFKPGMNAFIIGGSHVGEMAIVKEVGEHDKALVTIGKEDYTIVKHYIFVTGEKKEELKLNE